MRSRRQRCAVGMLLGQLDIKRNRHLSNSWMDRNGTETITSSRYQHHDTHCKMSNPGVWTGPLKYPTRDMPYSIFK